MIQSEVSLSSTKSHSTSVEYVHLPLFFILVFENLISRFRSHRISKIARLTYNLSSCHHLLFKSLISRTSMACVSFLPIITSRSTNSLFTSIGSDFVTRRRRRMRMAYRSFFTRDRSLQYDSEYETERVLETSRFQDSVSIGGWLRDWYCWVRLFHSQHLLEY